MRFSASQTHPQCTHEVELGQGQSKSDFLVVKLSDATSPQMQIELLGVHLQIDGRWPYGQGKHKSRLSSG